MLIEIFADNLRKSDTLKNIRHAACKLILTMEDKVFVWHMKQDDLYFFPSEEMNANEIEAHCLSTLLEKTIGHMAEPVKTITIREYFPGNSYVHHYYLLEVTNRDLLPLENENIDSMWQNIPDLLCLFDQYDGPNPYGTEIYEREFIALVNSI